MLRCNDRDWLELLPPELEEKLAYKLYYGHFMCHVMYQDYVVKKGEYPKAIKVEILWILDQRGAKYPAEHNLGR